MDKNRITATWLKRLCISLIFILFVFTNITFAVENVTAFFRNGQTFITWLEDQGTHGEKYRIYRHHVPITTSNLQDAALLAELAEGSSTFREMHDLDGNSVQLRNFGNALFDPGCRSRYTLHLCTRISVH